MLKKQQLQRKYIQIKQHRDKLPKKQIGIQLESTTISHLINKRKQKTRNGQNKLIYYQPKTAATFDSSMQGRRNLHLIHVETEATQPRIETTHQPK
jgi:hypothetical protein